MKKTIFILSLFLLTLISITYASNCTTMQAAYAANKIYAYYSFDVDSHTDDSNNNYDLSGSSCTISPARWGNGCLFDGDDRTKNTTIVSAFNLTEPLCISLWFNNTDATNAYNHVIFPQNLSADLTWGAMAVDNGAGDAINYADTSNGAAQNYRPYTTYTDTLNVQYHMVWCSGRNGEITSWINNASQAFDGTPTAVPPALTGLVIGGKEDFGTNAKVKLDEIWLFGCEPSNDAVDQLYRGLKFSDLSGGGTTPSLTLTHNLTSGNYTTNRYVGFTGTSVNNSNFYNCTLRLNNTINTTSNGINLSATQSFSLDWCAQQAGYNVNVTCLNENATSSFAVSEVFLDCIAPTLTMSTNFVNNTKYYEDYDEVLNFSVTFADENLFAINVSIWYLNETNQARRLVMNQTNMTNLIVNSIQINTTINLDNDEQYNFTRYEIEATAWDSHTGELLTAEAVKLDDMTISYKSVLIYSDAKLSSIQETDRVKFAYTGELCYETPYNFIKVVNTKYPNHYVDFENKIWIDDYSEDVFTEYRVGGLVKKLCLPAPKGELVAMTESIGDLNKKTTSWFFNYTAPTRIIVRDLISNTTITNFTANITQGASWKGLYTTTDGILEFNATSGNFNFTLAATNYITQTNQSAAGAGTNLTFYLTAANSLYMFIYDEQTNELIDDRNVTIEVVNYLNASSSYLTDTGSTFVSGFAAGDYEIRYWANAYTKRVYYTEIVGSDTQLIRLYLLNTSAGDYKLIQIYDQDDIGLGNATLSMLKHFIDCNCFRIVEMAKTDERGNTFVFAELYDTPYKFYVDYAGVTELMTDTFRLDSRDLYFKLNLLDTGLENYWDAIGVTSSFSVNSTSNIFDFDYSGSPVVSANLVVKKADIYGTSVIANYSLAASTGSITYNATNYTGKAGEFIGEGYVNIGNQSFLIESQSYRYLTDETTYGLSGVFLVLVIILAITAIGLYNPAVAIGMALFALVVVTSMHLLYLQIVYLVGLIISGIIVMINLET